MRQKLSLYWYPLVVVFVGGCSDFTPSESRSDSHASTAIAATVQGFQGVQYYRVGERQIALEIDPGVLTVEELSPGSAVVEGRAVLGPLGISIQDGGEFFSRFHHRLLRYSASPAQAVVEALRASGRFGFVAPGYRYPGTNVLVRLLNHLDVKFREGVSEPEVSAFIKALGLRTLRPPMPDSGYFAYRLVYPPGVDPLEFANSLYGNRLIEWSSPDMQDGANVLNRVPSDPYYNLQFYLKNPLVLYGVPVDIDIESAWPLATGSGVRITVVDDGVDVHHAELVLAFSGANTFDAYPPPPGQTDSPFEPYSTNFHGTAVAGMIFPPHNATGIAGAAPGSLINVIRIFRDTLATTDALIADGYNRAWQYMGSDVISSS